MPKEDKPRPRYRKAKRFENPHLEVMVVPDDRISPAELDKALHLLASWIAEMIREESKPPPTN